VGDGEWVNADALPMTGNQKWHLAPEQTLSKTLPSSSASITYTYDPSDPVPSLGGEIYGEGDDQFDGSFDQTPLQSRQDVIVFTTDELDEDLTLFGLSNIVLSFSSNQPDTDLTVKINEVYANGEAYNLGDTILRMRYREGIEQEVYMQKGEVYTVVLPPIMLSKTIAKGHRLQVEVSSSNFPNYSRNLNTRANPYTSTETVIATNTLHFGGAHKAYVNLPVR
jgi:putative CocE/NonD family hydrolase